MKYGRLVFSREFVSSSTVCNVGDFVQTYKIAVKCKLVLYNAKAIKYNVVIKTNSPPGTKG